MSNALDLAADKLDPDGAWAARCRRQAEHIQRHAQARGLTFAEAQAELDATFARYYPEMAAEIAEAEALLGISPVSEADLA